MILREGIERNWILKLENGNYLFTNDGIHATEIEDEIQPNQESK